MTDTLIPAANAKAGKMRCALCLHYADGVHDFILRRDGDRMAHIHAGSCPESSGWGKKDR